MKKNLSSSFHKNYSKNLPQINTSNLNLSINNTFILIRNNTQENLSFNQNNKLPNIFKNPIKKKETILTPLKFSKTKVEKNIRVIKLKKKISIKSETGTNPMLELMMSHKILNKFLYFFNIRELLILMNINKKINNFIKNTEVFRKYIEIKKDIKNRNLFKDIKKDNRLIKNIKYNSRNISQNITYQLTSQSNFLKNNNKNININNFLKYNLLNKNKIKIKRIINPTINKNTLSFKILQNFESIPNSKMSINSYNHFESSRNSVFSSKTGSSKYKSQTKEKIIKNDDIDILNINELDIKKLKILFLSLIKNNGYKILLLMKKYKLNIIESKLIFNGIIESFIIKSINKNNHIAFDSLILKRINLDKYLDFYIEPILNLDFIKIRKINFDNIIISSFSLMKNISNIINKNYENIKILSLKNNNINDNYAKLLFKSIKHNKNISILNLDHNKISSKGIIYIESFLKNNNSLFTLVLSNNYLSTSGSNLLLDYLQENEDSNLKTLDISYNGIGEGGIESLVKYINTNKKLISLFISGNYLCDKGLSKFSNLLFVKNKNNKKIRISYLDISNNSFSKDGLIYINNILYYSSFISSINISYNNLGNESISNIISCINKQSKLVSLDLSKTNINEKCIEFISKNLDKNIILRILNLSYNNLNNACKYLKIIIEKESNLKIIKLKECRISQESNLIFQGLSMNQGLKTFDISNNYFYVDDNLLNDLCNFFMNNKKLDNLIMDNANIDDLLMDYICKSIEKNQSLKLISLKNNKITNQSAFLIINSLQKNENIRKIELEGNLIEPDIKHQINILLNEKLNTNKNIS